MTMKFIKKYILKRTQDTKVFLVLLFEHSKLGVKKFQHVRITALGFFWKDLIL